MAESIKWFRMYAEAVDDEKLRLLAFEDRWHFVALLCCKAQGLLDGSDPMVRRKLSVKLGLDSRELDEVGRRLAEVGLIDTATFAPLAWDRRQFRSDQDNTAAERARRYRESKRETDASRVTDTLRHGCVTRPETETEKEKNIRTRSRAVVCPESVPDHVWHDFLAIRKAKHSPLTATALRGIEREAVKAGMSLADALATCCERGWQGFKAEWVAKQSSGQKSAEPWAGAI